MGQDKYIPNCLYKRAKTSKEKFSFDMWSLYSGRRIGVLVHQHGDPGSNRKGASSLKYIRMLKKWLPDLLRKFSYGPTIYFIQDGTEIHRDLVVKKLVDVDREVGNFRQDNKVG